RPEGRRAVDPIAEPPRGGVDVVDAERGGRTHDGEIIYSSHATTPRARAGPAPRRLLADLARPHAADRAAPGADGRGSRSRQDPPAGRLRVSLRRGRRAEPRHRRARPAAGAAARPRPGGAEGLLQKLGLATTTIKSTERKDMGSPLRALTDEERKIFQSVIDGLYGQFVEKLAENRKLGLETARKVADGRIYTARQALDLKL